jgi:hypothetical protein
MKSKIHSSIPARSFAAFDSFDVADYAELGEKLGIHLDNRTISNMMTYAMDELQPLVTTASVSTPVQFLQEWLPGFVKVITAACYDCLSFYTCPVPTRMVTRFCKSYHSR